MVIKKLRLLLFSGTKQRCPLIPLLFNIVLDSLCSLMSDLRTQISLQIVTSDLGKYYEWLMIQYNTCHQRQAGHLSVLEIKKYTENIWNIRTGFKNNKNYSVYHLLLTEVLGCPVTKNPDWYLRYHLLPTYKWHYLFLNLSFNYPQTS